MKSLKTWGEAIGLTAQLFLSGSSQKRQIERLKKGPEILIGTPGRIFELIKLKKIKMMNVETIILMNLTSSLMILKFILSRKLQTTHLVTINLFT